MTLLRAIDTTPADGGPRGPDEQSLRGDSGQVPGRDADIPLRRSSVRSLVDSEVDRLLKLSALDLEIQRLIQHAAEQQR
jgi:hypothetical protein